MKYLNSYITENSTIPVEIYANNDQEAFDKLSLVESWLNIKNFSRSINAYSYLNYCIDGRDPNKKFEWTGKIFSKDDAKSLIESLDSYHKKRTTLQQVKVITWKSLIFPFTANFNSIKNIILDIKFIFKTLKDTVLYSRDRYDNLKENRNEVIVINKKKKLHISSILFILSFIVLSILLMITPDIPKILKFVILGIDILMVTLILKHLHTVLESPRSGR